MNDKQRQCWHQLFDDLNSAVRGFKMHQKNDNVAASLRLNTALDKIKSFVEQELSK